MHATVPIDHIYRSSLYYATYFYNNIIAYYEYISSIYLRQALDSELTSAGDLNIVAGRADLQALRSQGFNLKCQTSPNQLP